MAIDVTRQAESPTRVPSSYLRIRDREMAGRLLAFHLAPWRDRNALVLAVPRGGVAMGRIIADELDADLDVILVGKLGAPDEPELAIGAIEERGEILRHPGASWMADDTYIAQESRKQLELLHRRRGIYTPGRGPLPVEDRTVVLVDDGVCTGSTLDVAIRSLRREHAGELIVAAGVMSVGFVRHFERTADRVFCLLKPDDLYSVGAYYIHFPQISDDEVVDALHSSETGAISHIAGA